MIWGSREAPLPCGHCASRSGFSQRRSPYGSSATGVGKQRVIQALHHHRRRHAACVTVNAAAIPESLLDLEQQEGAFTDATKDRIGRFVEADGGVLVLDQVGDLPLAQQARLLRVLETGEVLPLGGQPVRVDVQVMATHHEPLQALVARGEFRADLYHRLAVHRVGVPSLAERLEDVPGWWRIWRLSLRRSAA